MERPLRAAPCGQLRGSRSKPEGILTIAMTRMMATMRMIATTQTIATARMMVTTQMVATTQRMPMTRMVPMMRMMALRRRIMLNCPVAVLFLVLVLVLVLVQVQVQVQVLVKLQFEQTPPERRQSQLPECPTMEPLSSDRFRRQVQAMVCGFCMHMTGLRFSITPLYLGLGKKSQGYRYELLLHS